MEKIVVDKEIKSIERVELEIEDIKNSFLKGNDKLNNLTNYLGICIDNQHLKIIEIRNQRMISIECLRNVSCGTLCDIERFIRNNDNVKIISRNEFKNELDRLIEILQLEKSDK